MKISHKLLNWGIGIGLLFPLFFQFSGGIYNGYLNDSGGNIATLPFPIATLVCFGGIVLLFERLREACIAWVFVVGMLLAMSLSVFLASSELRMEFRKLMLLAQFVMPIFGLALGQMVGDNTKTIPKAFLSVLLVVVPSQLLSSWMQGTFTLTHSLYVFSIYQHFQFVPLIFVCAFVYATAALWVSHRKILLILFPLMCIYVLASASFLAIAAFCLFVFTFVRHIGWTGKRNMTFPIYVMLFVFAAVAIVGVGAFIDAAKNTSTDYGDHGAYLGKFETLSKGKLPDNISERFADWKLFGTSIIENPRTMLFGHATPLPREVRTSAHNLYLDVVYSFGLISLLPLLVLSGYTVHLFKRARSSLTLETRWLAFIVLFLVVIDSNFKVSLRQPYPGIFGYFLWGLLLTRLHGSCRAHIRIQASIK